MVSGGKLEVIVEMCCSVCVAKVEDVVNGMPGVADFKVDRWKSLLTITQTPGSGIADHKQLLKKLRKATHDKKKAVLLPPRAQPERQTPSPATNIVYMHGPGYAVPWPPSSPFITNPNYLQHPARCGQCWRYSDINCANCGRGSNFG